MRLLSDWGRKAGHALAPSATAADWRTIVLVYLLTTAALWFLAYGASTVFVERPVDTWHYTTTRALDVWVRWDSALYLDIAQEGYRETPTFTNAPWFPLYSWLIRYLMPWEAWQYPAGQAISLVAFFLLLAVLFDVSAALHGKPVAHLAVFYISIFPSALFFRAVYAESLYTLLVLLAYRAFVRERYFRCGVYGALAAMTRVPGVLLLPAFVIAAGWDIVRGRKRFRPALLLIGLIVLGPAIVMAVQWRELGDPLAFLHAASRPDLQRSLSLPGWSVLRDLKAMVTAWDFRVGRIEFHLLLDDVVAILAGLGALYFFRRYGVLAGALSLLLILPALMSGRTIGMVRYVLPVFFFPIFLAELGVSRPWFHTFWTALSNLLLAFYTICFACWYWTA